MKYFASLLACMLFTVSADAQTTNGNIQGTIIDPNGATLVAKVTARNLDTGLSLSTVSTEAGLYSLPNLPPGRYSVTVEAPNLKRYTR